VVLVSDGETLWQYLPESKEYTRQATADLPSGAAETVVLGFTAQYMGIADAVQSAHIVDHETVDFGGREIDTIVVELTYAEGETPPELEGVVKRVWIDSASHLVIREEFTMHHPTSDGGSVQSDSVLSLVRADMADAVGDELFSFAPPDGATEVEPGPSGEPGPADLTGQEASDFTLKDGDGAEVTLSALRGNVVLLDFWATWCGPCRVVMPTLQKLHEEYADRGLLVYGVNNEEPTLVREFLTENGYTFPTLRDPRSSAFLLYQAQSIPTTVVVGRDGAISAYLVGAHPEEAYRAALAQAGIE
ncbi:redoxin domain-containing protein, partial [Candidatus Poribacteria bacterium]|nr:redoxin domain-containing protein [Candidatus Poribacteria bacterium]